MIKIYSDAGSFKSRLCIYDELKRKRYISYEKRGKSNNVLEYLALQKALKYVIDTYPNEDVQVFSDSQLIVNQISGKYKINSMDLLEQCYICKELLNPHIKIFWCPRTKNLAGNILEDMYYRER